MKGLCCFNGMGREPGQDSDPLQGNFGGDGGADVTIQQLRSHYAQKGKVGPCHPKDSKTWIGWDDGNKHRGGLTKNKASKAKQLEREVPGIAHGSRKTVSQNWYKYYCHKMGEVPTEFDGTVPRVGFGTIKKNSDVTMGKTGNTHQCIRSEAAITEQKIRERNWANLSMVGSLKDIQAQSLPNEWRGHQTFPRGKKESGPPHIPPLDFRRLPGYVPTHHRSCPSPTNFPDPPMKLTSLRHEFTLRWIRDEDEDIVAELKDSAGLTPIWQSPGIIDLFSSQIAPHRVEDPRQNSMTDSLKSVGEELVFNMMSPVPCFRKSCPRTRRPVGSKASHQESGSMAASDSVSTYAPEDELADMIAMQSILSGKYSGN